MPPLIEAHRGDSSNAPENTIAAFDRAIRLGVASIELDIHPCRDGTLMVIHDDTVDRTTDGSGSVSDFTVEQLLCLDAGAKFSPEFKGERIPRLTEVLQLVENTSTLPVQVNGKKRADVTVARDAANGDIEAAVLELDAVQKALEGKKPKKVIVVPQRIVNVVA